MMSILENLYSCFRIDANEPAAKPEEIIALIEFCDITVPDDYLSTIKKITEVEILVNSNRYFRIWSPSGCIEMNKEYHIQDYIPQSLAIGDDEGGSALILMTGKEGFGLYKLGFGNLDADDAEYIARSLEDLLTKGVGVDVV